MNDEPCDFDERLRRWAARPPATQASQAANTVVERISMPEAGTANSVVRWLHRAFRCRNALRVRLSPALATVLAASVLIIAGTASFIRTLPPVRVDSGSRSVASGGQRVPVPARDADVILWLDAATPVYVFLPDDRPAKR